MNKTPGKTWRTMTAQGMDGLARVHRLSAHGAGYSGFVKTTKYMLPLLALLLMGLVLTRLQYNPLSEHLTQLPDEEKTIPGQSELTGARYEGVDTEGRPFTLTADKAIRVMTDQNAAADMADLDGETVDLLQPRAEMKSMGKDGLSLSASEGRFEQDTSRLNLTGGVTLEDGRGNELWIDNVDVDLSGNALVADTPVRGQGPDGTVDAEGLRLEDGGARVIFTGRTTLTLSPSAPEGSTP